MGRGFKRCSPLRYSRLEEVRPLPARSAEFVYSKLCGSWFGNRRKAGEFLRNEILRYSLSRSQQNQRLESRFASFPYSGRLLPYLA